MCIKTSLLIRDSCRQAKLLITPSLISLPQRLELSRYENPEIEFKRLVAFGNNLPICSLKETYTMGTCDRILGTRSSQKLLRTYIR